MGLLGIVLHDQNRYVAILVYNKAIDLDPKNASLQYCCKVILT